MICSFNKILKKNLTYFLKDMILMQLILISLSQFNFMQIHPNRFKNRLRLSTEPNNSAHYHSQPNTQIQHRPEDHPNHPSRKTHKHTIYPRFTKATIDQQPSTSMEINNYCSGSLAEFRLCPAGAQESSSREGKKKKGKRILKLEVPKQSQSNYKHILSRGSSRGSQSSDSPKIFKIRSIISIDSKRQSFKGYSKPKGYRYEHIQEEEEQGRVKKGRGEQLKKQFQQIREERSDALLEMVKHFSKLDSEMKRIGQEEACEKLLGRTENLVVKNRQAFCRMLVRMLVKKVKHLKEQFLILLLVLGSI